MINRFLNENPTAGALAGAALFVTWFGGWVALGAVKLVKEAACGAAHPDERDAPARGWTPRPSIYRDGTRIN